MRCRAVSESIPIFAGLVAARGRPGRRRQCSLQAERRAFLRRLLIRGRLGHGVYISRKYLRVYGRRRSRALGGGARGGRWGSALGGPSQHRVALAADLVVARPHEDQFPRRDEVRDGFQNLVVVQPGQRGGDRSFRYYAAQRGLGPDVGFRLAQELQRLASIHLAHLVPETQRKSGVPKGYHDPVSRDQDSTAARATAAGV